MKKSIKKIKRLKDASREVQKKKIIDVRWVLGVEF
jgi:hypothetical protein